MNINEERNKQLQVDFIIYIQRLLEEGDFTSTYKFAFLHALADICVDHKINQNKDKLLISFEEIVDKFLGLYWQHTKPFFKFSSPETNETEKEQNFVLLQNHGKQSAIITNIIMLQSAGVMNIQAAKSSPLWHEIFQSTLNILEKGPLWRLQILSKQEDCFLFPHDREHKHIVLNPGIADCFRTFRKLVINFAQQGWVEKIGKIKTNQKVIGRAGELNDFLFRKHRNRLTPAKKVLKKVQQNKCFYCQKTLSTDSEVDHFIPFSSYNFDLGHNFVLAHKSCNNNKDYHLASDSHRERWVQQNLVEYKDLITQELSRYFVCDPVRSANVTTWAYDTARKQGKKFWLNIDTELGDK